MPTVNIFVHDDVQVEKFSGLTTELKSYIAQQLTCGDIALQPDEVSIRYLRAFGIGMLAPLEVEITAHAFNERIPRQDEICVQVREFLREKLGINDIYVWLLLPELGHSWD